jgi:hypothetical protein
MRHGDVNTSHSEAVSHDVAKEAAEHEEHLTHVLHQLNKPCVLCCVCLFFPLQWVLAFYAIQQVAQGLVSSFV